MKIALLADGTSIHVIRWANALASAGHDVHLLSVRHDRAQLAASVRCHVLPFGAPHGYFLNTAFVRKVLAAVRPNVLNTHFASGYGTLGRLSRFQPNVLSVWGSDVYEFPEKSWLHRTLLVANLRSAAWVCSTSHVMAARTLELFPTGRLSVVPFGIDTDRFTPRSEGSGSGEFVVGTVKALYPKYGIDVLIRAFAILRRRALVADPQLAARLRLEIVGSGPSAPDLASLAREVGVADVTTFIGPVPHSDVPNRLRRMDVYVALSRFVSESFGVAVLEASACGLPVIVSNVGGLPEVVRDGLTGVVVAREEPDAAARVLFMLATQPETRRKMGEMGRIHVEENYRWSACVAQFDEVLGGLAER